MGEQPPLEVRELFEQYRRGSDEAGRQLWTLYGALVRQAVRRRLPQRLRQVFDSEDFTQQVWASFFESLGDTPDFEKPSQLVAYLQAMAHNKIAEECRRRLGGVRRNEKHTRSLTSSVTAWVSRDGKNTPTPSEVAIERELLQQMLTELPEEHRRIVELRSSGLTYKEIGQQIGMHENSVRRIVSALYRRVVK